MKESADAGMDAHVPKPIDIKHLEAVIAELIKKETRIKCGGIYESEGLLQKAGRRL